MTILLVSATKPEITPLLEVLKADISTLQAFSSYSYGGHQIDVLITGVGVAQTAYYLGKHLSNKYDLAINAGVCGAFDRGIKLGEVVQITEDYFADLGAEDDEKFLSVSELNLPAAYYIKNQNVLPLEKIRQVRGVTVNTTHGNERNIQKFTARLKAEVESMEGAAFLWACQEEKVKCLQFRSVSNYVEKRDRSKWEINLAVKNLNDFLKELLSSHI